MTGSTPVGDEHDGHPKLWRVCVMIEAEADVYVWADDETEAERIATSDVELDLDDGRRSASAMRASVESLKRKAKGDPPCGAMDDWVLEDTPYGEPPSGVGTTLKDALDWMTRGEQAILAYKAMLASQEPLFDGVEPIPLPCSECGHRYPAESHDDDCPARPKDALGKHGLPGQSSAVAEYEEP